MRSSTLPNELVELVLYQNTVDDSIVAESEKKDLSKNSSREVMISRSVDGVKHNPGFQDCAALHPGYGSDDLNVSTDWNKVLISF